MDIMQGVTDTITSKLNEIGVGNFTVEARTDYARNGLDGEDKGNAILSLILTNPELESDANLQLHILSKLSNIPALADNLQFESERKHAENLARRLEEFRAADESGHIPANFVKWFTQQADNQDVHDHALDISKMDGGITIRIRVPQGSDPSVIADNLQKRLEEIKESLAQRTVKYTTGLENEEQKQALLTKIKNLDFAVSSDSDTHLVTIDIRSKEQLEARKNNKDLGQLTGEELQKLRDSNPLNALKDGDGKSSENPAHLQKAVARAVLFAGDTAKDIFPIIAGREDMKRAVAKSLVRLKLAKPELAEKVDAFINDDIFKEHHHWGRFTARIVGEPDSKQIPRIRKITKTDGTDNYTPGKVEVTLNLPARKLKDILEQIAGMSQQQTPAAEAPAVSAEQPAPEASTPEKNWATDVGQREPAAEIKPKSLLERAVKNVSETLGISA